MMRIAFIFTLLMLAAGAGSARGDTYHDKLDPSAGGGITGVIAPSKGLQTVVAVDAFAFKCYQASVDPQTGKFELRGLPPGEYDLMIKTVGKVYEGVTLETDPEHSPAAREMRKVIEEVGKTWFTTEDYFNKKRIARFTFNGETARMFTIQTRDRHVVTPGAEKINANIRRFDVVEMVKTGTVWQLRDKRYLLRQEVPYGSADIEIEHVHSPKLSLILVGSSLRELGTIDLDKLPRSPAGRYASLDHVVK